MTTQTPNAPALPVVEPVVADWLALAADLLEPEGAWTQGAFSRNADGSIDFGGEDGDPDGVADNPVCWCALGALAKVGGHDLTQRGYPLMGPLHEASTLLASVVGKSTGLGAADWNDEIGRTQAEVVSALREAAARAALARTGEAK